MALSLHDPAILSTALAMEMLSRYRRAGFMQSLRAAAIAVNQATPEPVSCPSLIIWGARDRILRALSSATESISPVY